MTFKPWTGRFFGLLFFGVMERKTGLSKWPILYRIVAAQLCLFGLTTLRSRSTLPVWAYNAEKRIDFYMPLAYSFSMQTVVETPMYLRAAEAIYSEADREEIVRTIASYPEAGDLMLAQAGTASCALHVRAWENAAAHESFICTAVRICRSSSSPCMPNRRRAI